MRTIFSLFFLFGILLVGTLATPQVLASCSIGASPLEMDARAKPGQVVEVGWNIFNLRGDRPTHVLVSKSEGPDWEVNYNPEAEVKKYEVAGVVTNSTENFAIDKSEVVGEKPEEDYVVHPDSSQGYIIIDQVQKIYVKVPENAEIGKAEEFKFTALGKCFGQTGAVTASVATELKLTITPTTEYYEKEIIESETLGKRIVDFFREESRIKPEYMIMTGITLILLIVFIILLVMAGNKKSGGKKKQED